MEIVFENKYKYSSILDDSGRSIFNVITTIGSNWKTFDVFYENGEHYDQFEEEVEMNHHLMESGLLEC
jgi:hypothetical protein|tara:strand:+ start:198 stop:401 length:204 start_codon:yes stop_codon:yes gene_type:complete